MQERSHPSPAELRANVSPVSERFAALTLGNATVVFDKDRPDRWMLSDESHDLDEMR